MWFRKRPDSDFKAEIEAHIRLETDRLIDRAVPPAEARAAAVRAFGNLRAAHERFYESQRSMPWEEMRRDLSYGVRGLAKSPSFTAAAVLTIALGVGANTAVFSLIDAVLLRALPVRDPASLVFLQATGNGASGAPPFRAFAPLRDGVSAFSGIAVSAADELRIEIDGQPEPVNSQVVTGDYFSLLGVTPAIGRLIDASDEREGTPVAVIGERYWRRRFASDPNVIGKTFTSGGVTYTIAGVTAASFEGHRPGFAIDVTLPFRSPSGDISGHDIVARLRPGVSQAQAAAESSAVLRAALADAPAEMARRYNQVVLLPAGRGTDSLRERFAAPLYALIAISGLVLLLASANIAGLLLARGFTRRREFAIRLAAGAGRSRLVRQIVTETLLLFSAGALPGLALAYAGVGFVAGMFAEGRRGIAVQAFIDWRVLVFALAVTVLAGLFAALFPAWRLFRSDLENVMRDGQVRGSESHGSAMLRQGLVAAQVAVSLILLVGAVSFAGTVRNLRDIDPGFRGEHVLTLSVELPPGAAGRSEALWRGVESAVRELPGVRSVALSNFTPLSGRDRRSTVALRGSAASPMEVHIDHVTADYFQTFGIALRDGQLFSAQDDATVPPAAVVNESAARALFGTASPLGEVLSFPPRGAAYRIAGVVRDTKHNSLREPPAPFVFLPLHRSLGPERRVTLSVAAAAPGGEASLLQPIRARIATLDPGLMISEVITMRSQVDATMLTERLLSSLAAVFGALATLLAAVGLYGVLSYRVSQQRQAIGIRIALGETPAAVVRGVLRQSAWVIAAGLAAGLPIAIAGARAAASLLWGVQPDDPAVYAVAASLLGIVGLGSAWIPARRAAGIDPAEALRHS